MSSVTHPRTPCPEQRTWDELAAGLLLDEKATEAAEHASLCPSCARLLREAIAVFAPELELTVPEEKPAATRRLQNFGLWPKWAIGVAAMLVVGTGVGYLVYRYQQGSDPSLLLAQAYTAHRTIAMRLPHAVYGPVQVERGTSGASREFSKAELVIRRRLTRDPADRTALRASGVLYFLEGRADDAVKVLDEVLSQGSAPPDLLIEAAMAYYARDRSGDRSHSIELLNRALDVDPANPAALFNRAIAEDEQGLSAQAIADFERLLTVESMGAWSDEARERLRAIRARRAWNGPPPMKGFVAGYRPDN